MPELKPIYLITGTDRPKIRSALERLRGHFDPDAVELLSAADISAAGAVAACNALGLFADGGRLIVVEGVDGHRNADHRLVGGWKAADVKEIEAYAAAPAPGTVLALVAGELKASAPLAKACAKAGTILAYEAPKKSSLPRWVGAEFSRRGAQVDADACELLVELAGEDPDTLATEIDKLVTWAAGDPIGAPEVERLVAHTSEASIFSLTDAWGRRDLGAVLAATESLLEHSPRDLTRVLGVLVNHVGKVRACQALAAEGVRSREAAGRLKMHPWVAEKAFVQAANFGVDELRDAVVRLAELDLAVKGGSRLSPELELSRALVAITRETAVAAL